MPHTSKYDTKAQSLVYPTQGLGAQDFFGGWTPEQFGNLPAVCAELCRLVYGRPEFVKGVLAAKKELGFDNVEWIGGESVKKRARSFGADGFVAERDGTLYVVFRGTQLNRFEDLVTDLMAISEKDHDAGRVHAGFAETFERSEVEGRLEKLLANRSGKVVFAGHSLGGAMATLAAASFGETGDQLITFGSPRVGDPVFAAELKRKGLKIDRYVLCCDIIARLPPKRLPTNHPEDLLTAVYGHNAVTNGIDRLLTRIANMLAGGSSYEHVGDIHYIDRNGALHQEDWGWDRIHADQEAARARYTEQYGSRLPLNLGKLKDASSTLARLALAKLCDGTLPSRDTADHNLKNYLAPLLNNASAGPAPKQP